MKRARVSIDFPAIRSATTFLFVVAASACTQATPTPASTATSAPAETASATPPSSPTVKATATVTVTATVTATQAIVSETTPPGSPEPDTAIQSEASRPLRVSFADLHYECRKECFESRVLRPGEKFWAYRSLQLLMVVENVSENLILPGGSRPDEGWAPRTWHITDGISDWTETYAWQWIMTVDESPQDFYRRPDLAPGDRGEWTWMTLPLPFGAWVHAVDYADPWGNIYRQEFARPADGEFNYLDCGDPKEGTCP